MQREFLAEMLDRQPEPPRTYSDADIQVLLNMIKGGHLTGPDAQRTLEKIDRVQSEGRVDKTLTEWSYHESKRAGRDIFLNAAQKKEEVKQAKSDPALAADLEDELRFLVKRQREERAFVDQQHRAIADKVKSDQAAIADAELRLQREAAETAELEARI